VAAGSILLVQGDTPMYVAKYLSEVEGFRPDVTVALFALSLAVLRQKKRAAFLTNPHKDRSARRELIWRARSPDIHPCIHACIRTRRHAPPPDPRPPPHTHTHTCIAQILEPDMLAGAWYVRDIVERYKPRIRLPPGPRGSHRCGCEGVLDDACSILCCMTHAPSCASLLLVRPSASVLELICCPCLCGVGVGVGAVRVLCARVLLLCAASGMCFELLLQVCRRLPLHASPAFMASYTAALHG